MFGISHPGKLHGVSVGLPSEYQLRVGGLIAGGVLYLYEVLVVRNAGVLWQLKQSDQSSQQTNKLSLVLSGHQLGGRRQHLGQTHCCDPLLCRPGDLLDGSVSDDEILTNHPEHAGLDAVDHLDQFGAAGLDDEDKEEDQERLDVLGGLAGAQPLEQEEEDLLEIISERLSGHVLNHRLEEVESLVIVVLAGYQLLEDAEEAGDVLHDLAGAPGDEGLQEPHQGVDVGRSF